MTRWLDYFFNIGPLATMKIAHYKKMPKAFAKSGHTGSMNL